MRPFKRSVLLFALASSTLGLTGCPQSSTDANPSEKVAGVESTAAPSTHTEPTKPTTPGSALPAAEPQGKITPENILESERYWPEIVALTEPWLPPGSGQPLKKSYRGALIRVDEQVRARIDFGRHGKYDVPIEFTDLIERANQVESGALYKMAPIFVSHFGTLFLHPSTPEMVPYPTAELAKAQRFLCLFANPRDPRFEALARQLAKLNDPPGLQMLLFPLSMKQTELEDVKDTLKRVAWPVPFAYPEAAEMHARALLGDVPASAVALLVTAEGRVLDRETLSEVGAFDSIRASLGQP